jgi:hypothetical protein
MCRRVSQTRIAPEISAHVPGNAVNINSLNKLHKLAWDLQYVAPWHCIAGVTQKQTRRKPGAQNFRSKGFEAHDSGVAGAVTCLVS